MSNCDLSFLSAKAGAPDFAQLIADCGQTYSVLPFLHLYFNILSESHLLAILLIAAIIPLCFYLIKLNADKFLSTSITRIREHFAISPIIASCTLIPFVNGAPDIICSITSGEKPEGIEISVGCLVGSFVFGTGVILAVIVKKSSRAFIEISGKTLAKEFGFYFLALTLVILFGMLEEINFYLAGSFVLVYAIYLYVTFKFNFINTAACEEDAQEELESITFDTQLSLTLAVPVPADEPRALLPKRTSAMIKRAFQIPFKALFYLTIPSKSNPLMKGRTKYLVTLLSIIFSILSFHVLNDWIMITFASYAAFMVVMVLLYTSKAHNEPNLPFVFLTLVSSLTWMKILCSSLLDSIIFVSALMKTDQTFLSMVIISIGNSLQDLFFNAALAGMGFEQMAIIATVSSQIFNLLVGLWLNFLIHRNYDFNIFHINEFGSRRMSGSLVAVLLVFAVLLILANLVHLLMNNNHYSKGYFCMGTGLYAAFFLTSLAIAVYSAYL